MKVASFSSFYPTTKFDVEIEAFASSLTTMVNESSSMMKLDGPSESCESSPVSSSKT